MGLNRLLAVDSQVRVLAGRLWRRSLASSGCRRSINMQYGFFPQTVTTKASHPFAQVLQSVRYPFSRGGLDGRHPSDRTAAG